MTAYKKSIVYLKKKNKSGSITKTRELRLRSVTCVYSENIKKHTDMFCGNMNIV